MQRTRAITWGVATLAVALGTGALVQQFAPEDHPARPQAALPGDVPAEGFAETLPEIPAGAIRPLAADTGPPGFAPSTVGRTAEMPVALDLPSPLPDPLSLAAPHALPPGEAELRLAEGPTPGRDDGADPLTDSAASVAPAPDCTPQLYVVAAPAAMLDIAYDAPCDAEARVVVSHGGLAVTGRTSARGALDLSLPAFDAAGEVSIRLAGRDTVTAAAAVADLERYDRAAVQWQHGDAFQLHAYEFGAAHGAPGHVSAANPAGPARAINGTGGFLTLLGDEATDWPLLAEVYSFPAGRLGGPGTVELVLEAAITEETCGREILGEALEMRRGGAVQVTELFVQMPGCDAIGGYVLLNNLLDDITLARN